MYATLHTLVFLLSGNVLVMNAFAILVLRPLSFFILFISFYNHI